MPKKKNDFQRVKLRLGRARGLKKQSASHVNLSLKVV